MKKRRTKKCHATATNSPTNHIKNLQKISRKKATHASEFVANRRLSYNCGQMSGGFNQHHWQLKNAAIGTTELR